MQSTGISEFLNGRRIRRTGKEGLLHAPSTYPLFPMQPVLIERQHGMPLLLPHKTSFMPTHHDACVYYK